MRLLPLLFVSFLSPSGFTESGPKSTLQKPEPVVSEIERSLKSLRQKSGAALRLKKRTTNTLLGREKKSEGRLYYKQGKLRLELKAPEDTLVIMDGKTLWLVTVLGEELGGKTMVTKTSARSFKKASTIMAALIENQKLLKEFNLQSRQVKGEEVQLSFLPKNKEGEIQSLDLWLNPQAERLLKVVYTDDKENEVEFELGVPEVIESDSTKLFSYVPPKGAEVTEI